MAKVHFTLLLFRINPHTTTAKKSEYLQMKYLTISLFVKLQAIHQQQQTGRDIIPLIIIIHFIFMLCFL